MSVFSSRCRWWMAGLLAIVAIFVMAAMPRRPSSTAPPVIGRTAAVSAGHPLTTAAAFEILVKGGNAFDAGVAAMLVGGVVEQDLYSLGGEGSSSSIREREGKVTSIVGQDGRRRRRPSSGTRRRQEAERRGARSRRRAGRRSTRR